jgi:hypothetical protein
MQSVSKVYVPQEPTRWSDKEWVPLYDLSPAEKYGEIVLCCPHGTNFINAAPLMVAIRERMQQFSEGDYLLAIGDPIAISVAAIIAFKKTGGDFKMLKWDRLEKIYTEIHI